MSTVNTTNVKNAASSTNNIVLGSSGDTQVQSLNGGQLAGFRNQIINGNFIINQRGLGPFNNSGSYEVTSDRWRTAANQGPQVQVTEGNGAFNSNRINANSANIWISTGIELPTTGDGSLFQPNSTWTFSVYANPGQSIQLFVNYGISILGSSLLTVFDGNLDETTKTSNGKVQYTKTITFPSTAVPSTAIMLGVGMRCTAAVDYSLAQLEPGPVATPFEHRPVSVELSMCQRYYWNFSYSVNGDVMYFTQYINSGRIVNIQHPVQMRTTPTVVSVVSSGQAIYNSTGSEKNWLLVINTPSSDTTGYYLAEWTADAEL